VPQNLYTVNITGTELEDQEHMPASYQIRVRNFSGIHNLNTEIPKVFSLEQNYPNPFNPTTNIVCIANCICCKSEIYDALGREVESLLNNHSLQAAKLFI
jgi:hypothetical protein